jgi:hypothetical protein
MAESEPTLREVLSRLEADEQLGSGGVRLIETYLEERESRRGDPIHIKLLAGFGAWLSALFFFAFLFVSDLVPKSCGPMIAHGVFYLGAAVLLRRSSATIFATQFALVLSITGNLLVISGIGVEIHREPACLLVLCACQAVLCAIVYPVFNDAIYRFLSPLAVIGLAVAWISDRGMQDFLHLLIVAETVATGALFFLVQDRGRLRPLRYAMVASLPATILLVTLLATAIGVTRDLGKTPLWPSSAVLAAALIALFIRLGGRARLKEEWMVVAIVAVILLGAITSPGVLVAIGLLVMGYALGERILLGMAFMFLPVFLTLFYYALDVNLAYKSWTLAGSGAVLLATRWILGSRPWAREQGA